MLVTYYWRIPSYELRPFRTPTFPRALLCYSLATDQFLRNHLLQQDQDQTNRLSREISIFLSVFFHLIYIRHLLDSVKPRAGSELDRISAPSFTADSEIANPALRVCRLACSAHRSIVPLCRLGISLNALAVGSAYQPLLLLPRDIIPIPPITRPHRKHIGPLMPPPPP